MVPLQTGRVVRAATALEACSTRTPGGLSVVTEQGLTPHLAPDSPKSNLRHVFIQAAHNARHQPQPRARLRQRYEGAPADLVEMAARAQERLYHRYWHLARRIGREKAVVAVARELAGFAWANSRSLRETAR